MNTKIKATRFFANSPETAEVFTRNSFKAYSHAVIYVETNRYVANKATEMLPYYRSEIARYAGLIARAESEGRAESDIVSYTATLADVRKNAAFNQQKLEAAFALIGLAEANPHKIVREYATFHGTESAAQKTARSYKYATRASVVSANTEA